jgi:hypothetical protein
VFDFVQRANTIDAGMSFFRKCLDSLLVHLLLTSGIADYGPLRTHCSTPRASQFLGNGLMPVAWEVILTKAVRALSIY